MKKQLLLILCILMSIDAFSTIPINIIGEFNVEKNLTYSYQTTGTFPSSSGTKAKWTITNGRFEDNSSTTLYQDLDSRTVRVVWTGTGIGTISFSYQNGSGELYEGSCSVTITGSNTDGGSTGGSTGGNNNYYCSSDLYGLWRYISDPKRLAEGDTGIKGNKVVFDSEYSGFTPTENKNIIIRWRKSDNLDFASNTDSASFSPVFKVNKNLPVEGEDGYIMYLQYYYDKDKQLYYAAKRGYMKLRLLPMPYLVANKRAINIGQDIELTVENASDIQSVNWSSNANISLVSGQGSINAIFNPVTKGEIFVDATIKYIGREYNTKERIWVGAPSNVILNSTGGGNLTEGSKLMVRALSDGATTYKWRISTGISFTDYPGVSEVTTDKGYVYLTGKSLIGNRNQLRTIYCTSYNDFGEGKGGVLQFNSPKQIDPDNGYVKASKLTDLQESYIEDLQESYDIRIYSISSSRLVYTENDVKEFDLNKISLPRGIYLIEKIDSNGNKTKQKVLKN